MVDAKHARPSSGGTRYWVLSQHGHAQVIAQNERPDTTAQKGERRKRVRGPFANKADADAMAAKVEARAIGSAARERRGR